jgi:hypothetical protein
MKYNEQNIGLNIPEKIKERYFRILEQEIKDKNGVELTPEGLLSVFENDPSHRGKYIRWMIDVYKKMDNKVFYEDLYKIKESIEIFEKVKTKLSSEERNILSYPTHQELWKNIKQYKDNKEFILSKNQLRGDTIVNDEYDTLLVTDLYKVIVVKTHRSSCYWGSGTRWCTAVSSNISTYLEYANKGPLCIIHYNDGDFTKNIQFHIEKSQYMDYDDNPIEPEKLFTKYGDVLEVFAKYIEDKRYNFVEKKELKFYQDSFLRSIEKKQFLLSKIYIAHGASINGIDDNCISSIPLCNALYLTDEKKSLKMVNFLLKNGASVNIKSDSTSLAHIVASTGRVSILKLLLEHNLLVNTKDSFGRTPLHISIMNRHIDMTKELINLGLSTEDTDYSGKNSIDLVKDIKYSKIV